jgi:hypothetical protein
MVNNSETKAYNEKMPGTQNDADFGILVFPDKLIASDSSFGDIGPGQGGGNSAWVREGDRSVIAHEVGHCLGQWGSDHDLYRQGADPAADDLQTKEGAWAVYVNGKKSDPDKIYAVMGGDVKSDRCVFVNSQQWNHYTTLFDKLKKTSSASLSYSDMVEDDEEQFVAIGNISIGNQTAEALVSVASSQKITPSDPESPYKLVFSSGSATLLEYPFPIDEISPPEGYNTWPSGFVSFNVVAPYPSATQLVELRHEESILTQFERTQTAPSVVLISPNGGESYGDSDEVRIEWDTWDDDSEELTSTVYYSPDGGDRWHVLASGILENEFLWALDESPGTIGSSGIIQVVVSDGFNSGQDQSDGLFAVAGKPPQAVILAPEPNQVFLQCERPFLRAMAYDPEGLLGQTTWYVDGEVAGYQQSLQIESLSPGEHVIAFEVWDLDDNSALDEITIIVLADSDCDGMSDEFEEKYGLEPGFVEDTSWDGDEDGLINLDEAWLGLDPTNPDTDGDGLLDGEDPDPLNPSPDSDGDGVLDWEDNCPDVVNPDQADTDVDGKGDVCEGISHWDFDGDALDSEGVNHLSNHGAAFVDGVVCQALDFDGVNDYLERDTCRLAIAPGSFTVYAWVKPDEVTGGWRTILEYDRYDGGGPATSWFGIWLNSNGNFHFRIGSPTTIDSITALSPDEWYLLTATYNAVDNQAILYINGNYENSAILSPLYFWNAPADSSISIGRRIIGDEYFNGVIDEVMIFDRALSQTEINKILGKPMCWCGNVNPRQCHGDADGRSQGKKEYWASTDDLDVLIAAWNKPLGEIEGKTVDGVPLICADFDHEAQGKKKYRVSTNDLDILIANWNIANKPDPDCP